MEVLANKALIIACCAWAVAQTIKVFIGLAQEKRFDWHYFVSSGGMPSAHSSTVCALATAVAMTQGLGSAAFAIAAILAIVVMYDAANVRQSVDKQAAILNRLIEELKVGGPRDEVERDLRELIGHTPFQVIAGGILGVLLAWVWLFLSGV